MGCALKGLDAALDALSKEQKAQEAVANKYPPKPVKVAENGDGKVPKIRFYLGS